MMRKLVSLPAYRLARWAIALLFLYAGVVKLADPQSFAIIIDAYGILPDYLIEPAAYGLPAIEVVAAIGLMADIRGSLAVIAGLLGLFIAVLGYGVWIGLDVDCGCFGPEDPEGRAYASLRPALYRDLLMALAIAYLYAARYAGGIRPLGAREVVEAVRRRS